MILINLLPHREARRQQRKRAYFAGMGLAAAVGVGVGAIWYASVVQMTDSQEARNTRLTGEIKRLDDQIKDIAELKSEIESLKARQKAVEDLQVNRNIPVYLLDELARHTPDGIYYTAIRQDGNRVTLTGIAQSNERVSELLRATQNQTQWLRQPELIEIKAVNMPVTQGSREQRRLLDFSVRVTLKQPGAQQAEPAASAASAPKTAT